MAHLLVVDDEPSICELLEISFRKEGHKVEVASNGQAAKRRLASQVFDIVISDICMPDMDGVELLQYSKEVSPATIFILITGVPTVDTAIDAVNFGADRYVIKGDRLLDELRPAVKRIAENQALKKEAGELRRQLRRFTGFDHIIGASEKMRSLFDLIETIAPQSSRVLITGESGTGKELVARAIHENSARAKAPFITINCGAFPETLLESELFGYLRGSFTGANENRRGLFQAADGGTLFMDEIGNMSLTMQVKLYRVLQEGKVRPLGSTEESDVDVRVIAATNKDFAKEIAEGRFREDLYYRLSVIPIHLPAAARAPRRYSAARALVPGSLFEIHGQEDRRHRARSHAPPGSLRLARQRSRTREHHRARRRSGSRPRAFPPSACQPASATTFRRPSRIILGTATAMAMAAVTATARSLPAEGGWISKIHIQQLERSFLLAAMERSGGVRTRAADTLKMSYRSFRHYAKKYGI